MLSRLELALLLLTFLPGALAAQSGEFGARARVRSEQPVASHAEDPTSAGTALELGDRVAGPRSLGDAVREAPGAQLQSTGAMGAFSSVNLRGAEGHEALVLLDEIPLVGPDGGAFDLSAYPAALFERIDVFRGGAPVWLGSGAIAGVLRLVPRRDHVGAYDVSASAGSFGTREAQAGASVGTPGVLELQTRAVVRGATNDYPYLDDRATRFDASDDVERRRRNAALTDASGLVNLAVPVLGGELHAIVLANGHIAGEPGPGSQPTPDIHRTRTRALVGVAYTRASADAERARLQLVAAGSFARDAYTDLYGELGTSRRWATRDDAAHAFVRAAGELRLQPWLTSTVVTSYAVDRYDPRDRFTFPDPAGSTRHELAAALELAAHGRLGGVGLELRPSARIAWTSTELHASRGLSGQFDSTRTLAVPTGRLGAGVTPLEGLSFSGSIATGTRLPTIFELFGDRGLVLPATDLKPVTSITYDLGVTFDREAATLELRGFIQKRRDEIASVRTAQLQISHLNLSEVEQRGLELGARIAAFDVFALSGAMTLLQTEDALGKRLPLRPMWNLFVRPELRQRFSDSIATSATLSAELGYRSFVFADRANLGVVAPCTTVALSGSLGFFHERIRFTGRLEDIADARCSDLVGYPLPGRSLLFTFTYQETPHDA